LRSNKESIQNELLALRCRRGADGAIEELIRLWEGRLFYYIRRLVCHESDAWDVLQETWVSVLRGIRKLRDPKALSPWLYRTARNQAMDLLRKRYRDRDLFPKDPPDPDDFACDVDNGFEEVERVHFALDQLPLYHREVLTLHFLEDLSLAETSEVLGIQEGTVKSRLYYAKHALREILEKEDRIHV
jgi:RNA polymerase sigma factor (sigma-70 family)